MVRILLVAGCLVGGGAAWAFSLLGPFEPWQVAAIGYNPLGTDIGGPHNLGEEFRWNTRRIVYGYDESFLNYFGASGRAAVEEAVAIINSLPPMSQLSADLSEFPTDTRRVNFQAEALGILDLKSHALSLMIEELGLAAPERYVWTLRDRRILNVGNIATTNYLVIQRNFDPVTFAPTPYINTVLYSYRINDPIQVLGGVAFADAVEFTVDPLAVGFSSVAGNAGDISLNNSLGAGRFYIGLTRDDVGGLRYLYRTNNYNVELLTTGTILTPTVTTNPPPPGSPVGTPPTVTTNVVVNQALRPGFDKIVFEQGRFDSLLGVFITTSYTNLDLFVTNSTIVTQRVVRTLTQPDVLFSAEDLGVTAGGTPLVSSRTATAGWANHNAINGQATLVGPGVITPQVVITFNKVGPHLFNINPLFVDEGSAFAGFVWGSFDGSTNPPVVYPEGVSIQLLESQVLGGGP